MFGSRKIRCCIQWRIYSLKKMKALTSFSEKDSKIQEDESWGKTKNISARDIVCPFSKIDLSGESLKCLYSTRFVSQ